MKLKVFLMLCLIALAGCVSVKKVETGTRAVGERLSMSIDGPWNLLDTPVFKPAEIWTMEGLAVDQLRFYSGIKDGDAVFSRPANQGGQTKGIFRKTMPMEELVSLFESMLTVDGSTFKLQKLEPFPFGGRNGFRATFERINKQNNVVQLGLVYGTIDKDELFAMLYMAPRLTFYPRHIARVESIAKTVVIR